MGLYKPEDYVIYIAILAVILLILSKVFEKLRLDKKFIKAITPYILVGVFIRVLADTGYFPFDQRWSVTPGVYIVTIIIASAFIVAGLITQKIFSRIEYWVIPFTAGTLIAAYLFYLILPSLTHPERIIYTLGLTITVTTAIYALSILFKTRFLTKWSNISIIFAHMLDASSTYVAYDLYGFYEEHILPNFFISLFGDTALIMIPIKLLIVGSALYYLEKWHTEEAQKEKDRTLYKMAKLLVFIIGIGPGIRNTMLPALNL